MNPAVVVRFSIVAAFVAVYAVVAAAILIVVVVVELLSVVKWQFDDE